MAIQDHSQFSRGSLYMRGYAFEVVTVGSATTTGTGGTFVLSTGTYDVSASSYGLSNGAAAFPDRAVMLVSGAAIRYLYDGTVPTTAKGLYADDLDIVKLDGLQNIRNFQAVRNSAAAGATQPTLHVVYERFPV